MASENIKIIWKYTNLNKSQSNIADTTQPQTEHDPNGIFCPSLKYN